MPEKSDAEEAIKLAKLVFERLTKEMKIALITLYTTATGFQDLEVKIAYGLARVSIESFRITG